MVTTASILSAMAFDLVEIPEDLQELLGEPEPGTRLFRAAGPREGFEQWWSAVSQVCGSDGAVSPGGVAMFVRASRTAVHKRLHAGQLTGFFYHLVERRQRWWRKPSLEVQKDPTYAYVPVIECKRWGELLAGKRAGTRPLRGEPERLFIPLNARRTPGGGL